MINNSPLEVGQVLWLKVKYQDNVISDVIHPMLIAKINKDIVEIIALDKTKGKLHQLFHNYNYYLNSSNSKEKVILEDSYAQLNTKITVDNFEELKQARKCLDKLSKEKLDSLLKEYKNYQKTNKIPYNRIVYMNKEDVLKYNRHLKELITIE